MADKIKKNDFVEVEYTGKIKETGEIFDTTSEEEAKKAEIYNPQMTYGPLVICVGENQLIKGLDEQIEGKQLGEYELNIEAEKAFGKRDAKMLKIVPPKIFTQQQIKPMPGLRVNIDNAIGTVKIVSGGRVIVDFNHPLSGKEIQYKIKLNKIITETEEKIKSYLSLSLNLKKEKINLELNDNKATIKLKLPEEITKPLSVDIKRLIGIDLTFKADESKA